MAHRQVQLPDRQHIFEVFESEYSVSFTVYHRVSYRTMQTARFEKKRVPNWEDLIGQAEDLAKKRYAADLFQRRRSGG